MDMADDTQLRSRLARLERELSMLRRELGERHAAAPLPSGTFRALHVRVGGAEYAIVGECVREIVRYAELAEIPNGPRSIRGALNLRGRAIVVLDVAERLAVGRAAIDLRTPIVVAVSHEREVGLLVERVLDVVTL